MRYFLGVLTAGVLALLPVASTAEQVNFGDDNSQWARDGECDDRRFRGTAMSDTLDRSDTGHDATDCRIAYEAGRLKLWDFGAAQAATRCGSIDFGNDTSNWTGDGLCDDYRFEGPGADQILLRSDQGRDASDCRRLCQRGGIAFRDY